MGPKTRHELTVADLKAHRWCVYHNDDEGFDAFEHVIPDTHAHYSKDSIEIELVEFIFAHGEIAWGSFDGSKSFTIFLGDRKIYLWSGIREPSEEEIETSKKLLAEFKLVMPVQAQAKWSRKRETFNGIKFFKDGQIHEVLLTSDHPV